MTPGSQETDFLGLKPRKGENTHYLDYLNLNALFEDAMKYFSLGIIFIFAVQAHAENWSQFRGPEGRGHVEEIGVPVRWSESDIRWRVELGGIGQSSPVIWGNRIFLTSAENRGKIRRVICLDKSDGRLLWEREISCENPEQVHEMNSWATPTCATDGERVFAFFGSAGLHSFDMEGKPLWSKNLGTFPGPWGVAASPVILDDLVVQNTDAEGESYLVAFDKETGEERWRTRRPDNQRGGWNTPTLIELDGRRELLVNGEKGIHAYDPVSGKEQWFCRGFNGRGTPTPEWAHGLVIVVNGQAGDVYAVKPGGSGDVTDSRMAWHSPRRGGRDLPSPMVIGNFLFITSMSGIASMYEARSGKLLWTERLEGNFSASPLEANGLIYIHNEDGLTYVIKPDHSLNVVAKNALGDRSGEIFRAAITPDDGRLYIRSSSALYCLDTETTE